MIKVYTFLFLLFASIPLFAVEDIDRLMVEKAQTPDEKKAIYKYLIGEAKEKKDMAKRLRDMAVVRKGGKAASQAAHKQELIEEAEALEKIAKDYEELAQKVKP